MRRVTQFGSDYRSRRLAEFTCGLLWAPMHHAKQNTGVDFSLRVPGESVWVFVSGSLT